MADPAETEADPRETGEADAGKAMRPLATSIALERTYRVDGKRVTVQAVLPSSVARVIGMEAAYEAARRIVLRVDSKDARIEEVPVGRSPPRPAKPAGKSKARGAR